MEDYCIENDLPRQREMADAEKSRIGDLYEKLAQARRDIEVEKLSGAAVVSMFEEYRQAMEYYFGAGRCYEALEQYRNEKG